MDLSRLELLAGEEALAGMRGASFLLCGLGGVGSWAAEALARCGAGHLALVDFDCIQPSNLNRQLPARATTIGEPKAEILARRLKAINPDIQVTVHKTRLAPDNIPAYLEMKAWTGVLDVPQSSNCFRSA